MSSKSENNRNQDPDKTKMSLFSKTIYSIKDSFEFLKYKFHMILSNMERYLFILIFCC